MSARLSAAQRTALDLIAAGPMPDVDSPLARRLERGIYPDGMACQDLECSLAHIEKDGE